MAAIFVAVLVGVALMSPASAFAVTNPTLAGSISDSVTLPGTTSVAVSGNYAYTTGYYAGKLTAIDISNPAHPTIAGSSAASNNLVAATTVNISGGYAFVVSKNRNGPSGSGSNDDGTGNSLTILNIASNPAQPTIVGSLRDATKLFGGYGVAVSGHYAYVAAQGCLSGQPCPNSSVGNSFAVIDISSISSPKIVAYIHNSALPSPWNGSSALLHATAVSISGNYAYVTAAYSDQLTVIDISNPLSPKIVASLRDTLKLLFPVDVAVSGNYAYVVDQISVGRITVVDVSNPANPKVVGTLSVAALNGAYRIRLRGDFAYVSSSSTHAVAVVDISNPLTPRLAGSFSDATRLNRTTGLDVDATGRYVIASSPYLSSQSQPLYPPYALQSGGPTITGTVTAITLEPTPVTVSISAASEPPSTTAQTSANFSFSSNESIVAMRCQIDGAPFIPCSSATSQTYASLGSGSHTFVVQASDSAGNTATDSYSWSITPPANTAPPVISGSAVQGQTLTASSGSWTGSPSFAYQWSRCDSNGQNCAQITLATSSTYTVQAGDVSSTLEVTVTAMTSAGSTQASSATGVVLGSASAPVNTVAPSISGSAVVGQTLTASSGSWSGSPAPSFSYQWEQCDQSGQSCTAVGGQVSTYKVQSTDVGFTLEVSVTATNSAGSSSASSLATAVVQDAASAPVNTVAPSISGSAVEGQTLTASPGSWSGSPAPSFAYQWQRCDQSGQNCAPIGAQISTYGALSADVGSTLEVSVTATNSSGSASAPSAATGLVTSAPGPVTPLLDNFNRANNTGPPGPNWTHMLSGSSSASNNLFITNHQLTGKTGANADYWNPATFGPNSEAWITVAVKPNVDKDSVVLGLRLQNPTLSTLTGYQADYVYRSGQPDQYSIVVRTTAETVLASGNGPTLNAGDTLLFRAIGSTIELWRQDAGAWTRILVATDSTFLKAGYLSLAARDGTVRLANFGGGTLP